MFQSVVVAGGYGTGREIVEFFLTYGPVAGLLAMVLVSTVIWSAVSAVTYEFARTFKSYEYRALFKHLLGRGWVLFEVLYIGLMLIVLAVIAAAAGSILEESFRLPYALGVLGIMLAVGYLVFRGSATIEKVLASWSLVLYAVYTIMFVWAFAAFGGEILNVFATSDSRPGWAIGGLKYAGYNLAVIPAVLFAVRHIESRKEAITSGLLTGVIGIVPGLFFYIAVVGQYPAILERPVPVNSLLDALGSRTLQTVFQIVLFGTLIETGTAMIHAVNQRIAGTFAEKGAHLHRWVRPTVALAFLVVATLLSQFGLVDLIASGYGTMTWGFLLVFVLPMLTWGVWLIRRQTLARQTEATLGTKAN